MMALHDVTDEEAMMFCDNMMIWESSFGHREVATYVTGKKNDVKKNDVVLPHGWTAGPHSKV
jgi:hypothetical protein